MSFLYLKSSRLLKDNNGKTILLNNSELPYHFTNSFKDPIKITPNTKIEIVNADLNIAPLHNINADKNNDLFTYSLGKTSNQFLQKLVKIEEGVYSNEELANAMKSAFMETNLLDNFDISIGFLGNDTFQIVFDILSFDDEDETAENNYTKIMSNMGLQASTAEQDAGVGTNGNEITIENRNSIENPNTLTKNSALSVLSSSTLTNHNKPTNLVSNLIAPTKHGVNNAGGTISTIFRPIKHLVFPDNYEVPTTNTTFTSVIGATTTTGITIDQEGGGHNLSFKFTAGATTYHCKFIHTRAEWDTITLPNSITNGNLPWGHFIIINTSNQTINTTLASNFCTLLLDTNDYKWKLFDAGTSGLSTFDFFSTANPAFVKTTATLTSLGNWGTGCVALTRGETAITGTNQMNNTNRFTRARVFNAIRAGLNDNENEVYADYSAVLVPSSNGNDSFVEIVIGEQEENKVAGETDWLDTDHTPLSDANKLSTLLPNLDVNDNIMITISMNSWYCVDIFITHDDDGDMDFSNEQVLIGTTEQDNTDPHRVLLPNNFTEASFPIMPLIGPNNGYVKDEQQTLSFGVYSEKDVSTHSLAKLNAYMNSKWGGNQTIPARSPKATYTNYCRQYNLENREIEIQPLGFSGVNTIKKYEVIDGKTENISMVENPPIYMNLCRPIDDTSRLSIAGFSTSSTKLPGSNISGRNPLINELYRELGMEKLLIYDVDDDDEEDGEDFTFQSISPIRYDNTATYIVNFDNLGKIVGQNGETNSISQIAAVIPSSELESTQSGKHYRSQYPLPVSLNAKTEELINNFQVSITNDDGTPAVSLKHPTTILCRLTE